MRYQRMILSASLVFAVAIQVRGADEYAIKAAGYLKPDGSIEKDVVLVVRDGRISDIRKSEDGDEVGYVVDRSDSYIGPGLVDIHVTLGDNGRNFERAFTIEPDADARNLFDPDHHEFKNAIRAGITTAVLAPSSTHVVGGTTAIVKTGGKAERYIGPGPLKMSLSPQAFDLFRVPTSLTGGLADLRVMIKKAQNDKSNKSAFAQWARGELSALVDVNDEPGISLLSRFSKEQSVKCVALYGNHAAKRLDDAKTLGQPIILGTYEFSDPRYYTRTPGILTKNEIPFALTSSTPQYNADWLRVGAAIAMKQGATRATALASVTTVPAEICGVADRVGTLESGKDADFVLYSGDPLDLTSRIQEVFVGGERVFVADELPTNTASKGGDER